MKIEGGQRWMRVEPVWTVSDKKKKSTADRWIEVKDTIEKKLDREFDSWYYGDIDREEEEE